MLYALKKGAFLAFAAACGIAVTAAEPAADAYFNGAEWIAAPADLGAAAPRFATAFVAKEKSGKIAICGLGQYVAALNGKPLGRGDEFNLPGWTRTSKTCFYNVFDAEFVPGATNILEITLGNGMYNVPAPGKGLYTKFTGSEGGLKLLVGGAVKSSVDGWTASRSKITRTHVYAGDDIDARADTSKTVKPVPAAAPAGVLREAPFVCRLQETREPVRTIEFAPGGYTADFGQNAAYVPELVLRGPRGSSAEIEFSEIPMAEGQKRIRPAFGRTRVRCRFTLAGTGAPESFAPPFFYFGFRYMQITLSPAENGGPLPEIVAARARVVAADMPRAGSFKCSNGLFNKIHDLCWWAQRSNMQSVFTDCPHREKLGWQEQNNLHADQIRWGWNADLLYAKTCRDLADSQLPNGLCPDIAPEYVVFNGGFRDSIEWGASMILIPWQQYEWTGDDSLIREYYPNMKAYHKFIAARSQDPGRGLFISPGGLGDWYWKTAGTNKPLRPTSKDLTATAFYYIDAVTMEKCARLLGKQDDAHAFGVEAERIRAAFNAKWWNPEKKCYENNSQTANSMALATGLADPVDAKKDILRHIVEDIRWRGNSLSAGEIGYPFLLKVLADNGRSDVIYDMTADTQKPGYGYMIAKGNTSCHEAWNANTAVSHNHFMMADIVDWFYGSLAGIKRTSPGFKTFTVAPEFLPGIDWVEASHTVKTGDIKVYWRRSAGGVALTVLVPPGTECTVAPPGAKQYKQGPGMKTYAFPSPAARKPAPQS